MTDEDLFVQSLQEQRWHEQHNEEGNVDDLWRSAVQLIKNAVNVSQPNTRPKKRQHWMSADTWNLVEKRRNLKANDATTQELNEFQHTSRLSSRP